MNPKVELAYQLAKIAIAIIAFAYFAYKVNEIISLLNGI